MPTKYNVTPAEWEIMEAIWSLGGSPAVRDVLESTFPNGEKAYTTVQTIMNTLVKKGLLRRKKVGLVNFYRPVRARDQVIKAEMTSMLAKEKFILPMAAESFAWWTWERAVVG